MKSTGIVRNLDSLGRIVIPMELRRTLQIKEKDPIEFFTEGNRIVLQKYEPGCCLCGNACEELVELYPGKSVCKPCIEIIVKNESKLIESFGTK